LPERHGARVSRVIKIGTGLLASALVIWMWCDSSPDRAEAINQALAKGQIGQIAPDLPEQTLFLSNS
jgi:hypothetical protein